MRSALLVCLFAAVLSVQAAGPWRVFNEDNDHWFCRARPEEANEAGLRAYVDRIADSAKPTHMFLCPCGQRASFDSKAGADLGGT